MGITPDSENDYIVLKQRLDALHAEIAVLKRHSMLANKRRQHKLDRVDLLVLELGIDIEETLEKVRTQAGI